MTTQATTTAAAAPAAARAYWCACGWDGTGLAAMQDHLDNYDDGTDTHLEMTQPWHRSTR